MNADRPTIPPNPTLEDWLAYRSRLKYLETLHFSGIDEVAAWVREYYRDPQAGRHRRSELEGEPPSAP
ncbi:MAG: hypothetical protein FJ029_05725 [Actinobacteria bacterium]|nr:hypothetical protein [Actinomycetota bacterium]